MFIYNSTIEYDDEIIKTIPSIQFNILVITNYISYHEENKLKKKNICCKFRN